MTSVRLMPLLAAAACLCSGAALAADKPSAATSGVEPEAVQALKRMSIYLGTLPAFEVTSDATDEMVTEGGQKLQFTRHIVYRVRRPNGFAIESTTDRKDRRLFYDGKQLTLFAPRVGLYASVDAPPTILQTLDAAHRYGVEIPLEDLFRWDQQNANPSRSLTSGFYVGYAKIAGLDTDQYAFREKGVDWQIWIKQGAEPVPLKVVITDRRDPAAPQYSTNLTWNVKPAFAASTFSFQAPKDAHRIRLAGQDRAQDRARSSK